MTAIDSFARRGLADLPAGELGPAVLAAWDDFLALAVDLDLAAPSRLPGWTVREVLLHLGAWEGHQPVADLVSSARASTPRAQLDADRANASLLAAHADATRDEVLDALTRAREQVADYFADGTHDELGRTVAGSVLGPLPVASVVHAACYELAVHTLDVAPQRATWVLLSRGLAALSDVTGALSARHGITATVAAMTPRGGWRFTSGSDGWTTGELPAGRVAGTGIEADAALILDVSAGRHNAVPLLISRKLVVHHLPSLLKLAPLIEEVPGIPGGQALKGAVRHLAGAGRLLGRLPGLRRG